MDVNAYLDRIDMKPPHAADAAYLRELHRAHQSAVPFENLSIHLGEPITLGEPELFDKIVRRRRGGFCYELNGLLALLLEELGYSVERLAARVFGGEHLGPPFDHLLLLVTTAGGDGPWLVDVGFGSHSTYPLDFADRAEQRDPGGVFRLADAPDGDVDVIKDGTPAYRIERRVRTLDEFRPTCWYQQTSPDSHFTRGDVCTRLDGDGRITLSGRKLIRTGAAGRTETLLDSGEAVLAAYREHFGVILDREPTVRNPQDRGERADAAQP
ncbi:arylamine N-acetyltransferase family protein [Actinoplanes aureus]|uniref:Arylamine N-acetyltransferase n=1 Tax=Actinoplanes aureus TaxID=2792083 RepID=A0A931C6F5_9ACTN|nr:arylamine N-acetyltransferase [Actinoplanes aureus]MBG0564290.1 arylamine N-acetyltransferase [Actinoplanes aureus]